MKSLRPIIVYLPLFLKQNLLEETRIFYIAISHHKAKKVSGFWSSVCFKNGAVTRFFSFFSSFCNLVVVICWPTGKYDRPTCIQWDRISHIQSMVATGEFTNRANVHTPM